MVACAGLAPIYSAFAENAASPTLATAAGYRPFAYAAQVSLALNHLDGSGSNGICVNLVSLLHQLLQGGPCRVYNSDARRRLGSCAPMGQGMRSRSRALMWVCRWKWFTPM